MTTDRRAQMEMLESLRGVVCPGCLGRKGGMKSFCGSCYRKLPMKQRHDLYNRMGDGYEEAHDTAMKILGREPLRGEQPSEAESA